MGKNKKKGWMGLPYWLWGGIIGAIICIIVFINFNLMGWIGSSLDNQVFSQTPLITAVLYLNLLIDLTLGLPILATLFVTCYEYCSNFQTILITFIWFVIYILIGIAIGWMIGKVKNRKK